MRSYTLLAKVYALGVLSTYSCLWISNDNSYFGSLFRVLKYYPYNVQGTAVALGLAPIFSYTFYHLAHY